MNFVIHDAPGYCLEANVTDHPTTGPSLELLSTWPTANHPQPHRLISLTLPPESFARLADVLESIGRGQALGSVLEGGLGAGNHDDPPSQSRERVRATTQSDFLDSILAILAWRYYSSGSFKVSVTWEGEFIPYTCSLTVGWGSSFAVHAYRTRFKCEPPAWAYNVHPYCLTRLLRNAIDCSRSLPGHLGDFELGMARSSSNHLDFPLLYHWTTQTTAAGRITLAQSQALRSLLGDWIGTALGHIGRGPDDGFVTPLRQALRKLYAQPKPEDPVARWAEYRLGGWFRDEIDEALEGGRVEPAELSWLLPVRA